MQIGERIVALVTEVHEGRIALSHDGLLGQLSVADLTWDQRRPQVCADHARVGQSLQVLVLSVSRTRFSASIKHLTPDPRASLLVGDRVAGEVQSIRAWGTLVALDTGLIALVEGDVDDLAVGDGAWFRITMIHRGSRRISCRRCPG